MNSKIIIIRTVPMINAAIIFIIKVIVFTLFFFFLLIRSFTIVNKTAKAIIPIKIPVNIGG